MILQNACLLFDEIRNFVSTLLVYDPQNPQNKAKQRSAHIFPSFILTKPTKHLIHKCYHFLKNIVEILRDTWYLFHVKINFQCISWI